MTRPRSQIVSLAETPCYHCISRCVRRAFPCGEDRYSGKNFDRRRPWLADRLALLGEILAIDIAACAVMSSHRHLVLHFDKSRARTWGRDEVIHRWVCLYKGDSLVHCYLRGEPNRLDRGREFTVQRDSALVAGLPYPVHCGT